MKGVVVVEANNLWYIRMADIWQRSRAGDVANRFLSRGANLSTSVRPADGGQSRASLCANSFNMYIIYFTIEKLSIMASILV